jgi:hypothetical protein
MANDATNATAQKMTANIDPMNWPPVDPNFYRNQDPQDLIRYRGQWVAWSLDGRRVLFASRDAEQLFAQIDQAGLTADEYVVAGIPPEGHFPEFGFQVLD